MPALERDSQRMVIAGAASLLGTELKSLLEEGRFAGWDLRLLDEDLAVGTLTEAGGEPAVILPVEADSFRGARFVFLACSHEFAKRCAGPAQQAGATILDFSRNAFADPDAAPWFPQIERLTGKTVAKSARMYGVFSAAGTGVAGLALALRKFAMQRMVALVNQLVSEAGRAGIEEMETQASQLLSFQSIGNKIFGVQTAFNMLHCYGPQSAVDLRRSAGWIRAEVAAALGEDESRKVSVQVVHSPVFYGTTFAACADLESGLQTEQVASACRDAGFILVPDEETGPSNVSVAGETGVFLAQPREDTRRPGAWWFWGAADNIRVLAANGIKLVEILS